MTSFFADPFLAGVGLFEGCSAQLSPLGGAHKQPMSKGWVPKCWVWQNHPEEKYPSADLLFTLFHLKNYLP